MPHRSDMSEVEKKIIDLNSSKPIILCSVIRSPGIGFVVKKKKSQKTM